MFFMWHLFFKSSTVKEPNSILNKLSFLFCILSMLFLHSCVEDADIVIEGADSKIYFYCEFEQQEMMAFRYSTATGLSDLLAPVNPTLTSEFDFIITEDANVIDPIFRYNAITENFESPASSINSKAGSSYSISTSLKDYPQLKDISATTYVPTAKPFSSLEVMELNKIGQEFGTHLKMKVRFSPDVDHRYYEVEAFTKYDDNGILREEPIDLELTRRYEGILAMEHRNSLLIDTKFNKGQYVTTVIDADISQAFLDFSEHIYFRLKTVTSAHYLFHENFAKRQEAHTAPLSEPVIYYTNIVDGLGLFSGYSTVIDSVSFK